MLEKRIEFWKYQFENSQQVLQYETTFFLKSGDIEFSLSVFFLFSL